ncbi:MAG TPA: type II toxin-antitoxin system PemK/MazF family toxin [Candidatus Acetothermia bacterium]|nr:type II toxin-antitoxin system PemK/MazF family toxin [Candidatus Acetothermia bacterium]
MVAAQSVLRGHVYLVAVDPTEGSEIRKTRPCVVISPDELNEHLRTCIVAPMTTASQSYPFRIPCRFQGKTGHVVLDQIRTVDRQRLVRELGTLSAQALEESLRALTEMFDPK